MDDRGGCFPEEIYFEILTRVPAKDLLRFKAVCKPWCLLISDRKFVKAHLHWASLAQIEVLILADNHSYYDYSRPSDSNFLSIKMQDNHFFQTQVLKACPFQKSLEMGKIWLHDSCNGLLLFQNGIADANGLILYNPVTRQCEDIPRPPGQCWLSKFVTALVHDDFTDRYKIFWILSKPNGSANGKCFSYKVGEGKFDGDWKLFEFEVSRSPNSDFTKFSHLLFLNHELYWVTLGDEDFVDEGQELDIEEYIDCNSLYLFSVHVAKESFRKSKIPLSPDGMREHKVASLSKVDESLCLMLVYKNHIDMRVLEDEANRLWTAFCKISLGSIPNEPSICFCLIGSHVVVSPMTDAHNKDLFDHVKIFIHHEDQFFLYDVKNKVLKEIGYLGKDYRVPDPHKFHFDSLVTW